MNTEQRHGFFYIILSIMGVLQPYLWFTAVICFTIDKLVWYLAQGREGEINKLIDQKVEIRFKSLELEVEKLKNRQ